MDSFRKVRDAVRQARAGDAARTSTATGAAGSHDIGEVNGDLARAVERWKAWFGRRDEAADHVLPQVARWEWSTGRRHSPLPLYFERFPGRGRLLREPPRTRAQHTESGISKDGRLLAERVYDYRDDAFETFVLHGESAIEIVQFSPGPHIPLEHALIAVEDGRVIRHESFRLNGYTPKMGSMGRDPDELVRWLGRNGRSLLVEQFRYEGQLREIEASGEAPGQGSHRSLDRITYDDAGSVVAIDRIWDNAPAQAVYRRRRQGQSLDQLRAAAVAELVPAIVGVVATSREQRQVYCLELSYEGAGRYFPPSITLGFAAERAQHPELAFRPLLGSGRILELPDPDRLGACRQFDQEVLAAQQWPLGRQMLREAAAALTRQDWTGAVDVTDDFVAFALDGEIDELDEALAASAPERVQAWRAAGWL